MTQYDVTPPPDRLAERVQIRTAFTVETGRVVRFVVQLEYLLEGEWTPVVRYDHDAEARGGHDVTAEGLHVDVFRAGRKVAQKQITGPIPADQGFDFAEDDLRDKAERYVKRFERWHDERTGTDL